MISNASKRAKARKGKKDDPLSPPKRSHFSIASMTPVDPNDPFTDYFWDSPTARSSSQIVLAMVDEMNEEASAKKEARGKAKGASCASRKSSPSPIRRPVSSASQKIAAFSPSPEKKHYVGAFSSAQPFMSKEEQEEYYDKVYPFNYLTLKEFNTTCDSIERVYRIEELTEDSGAKEKNAEGKAPGKSRTLETVILYCRYLEDQTHIGLTSSTFVDCMGYGGETCLYASAFGFKRILDIEITESSRKRAKDAISSIAGLSKQCTVMVGTIKDYFPYDAEVYYMDCSWVCDGRSWVDEGILIDLIFKLCKKCQASLSYLCLLTTTTELNATRDYMAPHMHLLLRTKVHYGMPDECTAWIFRIMPS